MIYIILLNDISLWRTNTYMCLVKTVSYYLCPIINVIVIIKAGYW